MEIDFKEVMSKRTDEELIKIVTIDRDGYQPLAVIAAEEEIKKRNIDTNTIKDVESNLIIEDEVNTNLMQRKASSLIRFVHYIIDTIAFIIVAFIFMLIYAFIISLFFNLTNQNVLSILGYVIVGAGFFSYYLFMEAKFQKTIGKFITKTKVLTENGDKPTTTDIVVRTFCRLVPLDRLSFLFTKNGFHDRLSNTIVVKDEN